MTAATASEQLMLERINDERAKAGVAPLAFNRTLNAAADSHSAWMISTDHFSHTGANGSSPTQRMQNAGYAFNGSWASGENIAWASTRAPSGYQDEVELLHTNLMNSPGHRANILNASFREIGIGFKVGSYKSWDGAFVTENFARSGSKAFLTGVAMRDRDGDGDYDIGEGLGGITVKAVSASGATLTTKTPAAGGYALALSAGTYKVTFSGGGIAPETKQVTIGAKNVKLDLANPDASGTAGIATVRGGAGDDVLVSTASDEWLIGGAGADTFRFQGSWGEDTIADFQRAIDHLDLRETGLNFDDVRVGRADADHDGRSDDTVVTAQDQSIKLLNVKAALVTASDFLF